MNPWDVDAYLQNEYLQLLQVRPDRKIFPAGVFFIKERRLHHHVRKELKGDRSMMKKIIDSVLEGKSCFVNFDYLHIDSSSHFNHSGFFILEKARGEINLKYYVTIHRHWRNRYSMRKHMIPYIKRVDNRIQRINYSEILIGANWANSCTLQSIQAASYFARGKNILSRLNQRGRLFRDTFSREELEALLEQLEELQRWLQ